MWGNAHQNAARNKVVSAILESEKPITEALSALLDSLPDVCRDVGVQVAKFGPITDLVRQLLDQMWLFRTSLQEKTNPAEKDSSISIMLGDLLDKFFCEKLLPSYFLYARGLQLAANVYLSLEKSEPRLAKVLEKLSGNKKIEGRSFPALLNWPLQHVKEISSGLIRVRDLSPANHPDLASLNVAVQRIGSTLDAMSGELSFAASFEQIGSCLRLFPAKDLETLKLTNPYLRWIKQGPVIKLSTKAKKQDRELILFNDMIVLCKIHAGSLLNGYRASMELKSCIPLSVLKLIDVPDQPSVTIAPASQLLPIAAASSSSSSSSAASSSSSQNGTNRPVTPTPTSMPPSPVPSSYSSASSAILPSPAFSSIPSTMSVISPINTNSSQTSNSFSVAASSASASAPSSSSSSDSSQPAATWVANIPSAGIASALQSLHSFQLVDDQRYLTICFRLRAEKLEWFQAIQQQQAAHRSRASSLSTPQLVRSSSYHDNEKDEFQSDSELDSTRGSIAPSPMAANRSISGRTPSSSSSSSLLLPSKTGISVNHFASAPIPSSSSQTSSSQSTGNHRPSTSGYASSSLSSYSFATPSASANFPSAASSSDLFFPSLTPHTPAAMSTVFTPSASSGLHPSLLSSSALMPSQQNTSATLTSSIGSSSTVFAIVSKEAKQASQYSQSALNLSPSHSKPLISDPVPMLSPPNSNQFPFVNQSLPSSSEPVLIKSKPSKSNKSKSSQPSASHSSSRNILVESGFMSSQSGFIDGRALPTSALVHSSGIIIPQATLNQIADMDSSNSDVLVVVQGLFTPEAMAKLNSIDSSGIAEMLSSSSSACAEPVKKSSSRRPSSGKNIESSTSFSTSNLQNLPIAASSIPKISVIDADSLCHHPASSSFKHESEDQHSTWLFHLFALVLTILCVVALLRIQPSLSSNFWDEFGSSSSNRKFERGIVAKSITNFAASSENLTASVLAQLDSTVAGWEGQVEGFASSIEQSLLAWLRNARSLSMDIVTNPTRNFKSFVSFVSKLINSP